MFVYIMWGFVDITMHDTCFCHFHLFSISPFISLWFLSPGVSLSQDLFNVKSEHPSSLFPGFDLDPPLFASVCLLFDSCFKFWKWFVESPFWLLCFLFANFFSLNVTGFHAQCAFCFSPVSSPLLGIGLLPKCVHLYCVYSISLSMYTLFFFFLGLSVHCLDLWQFYYSEYGS